MAIVINLNQQKEKKEYDYVLPPKVKALLEERKAAKREPLTAGKVLKAPGLEHLSVDEANEIVDTIKKFTTILFEMHCHKESTCIDNQQVVSLNQENKAA